ncbi:MAG: hypothetical protein WCH37_05755 [Synechococcaceae cyanobacterium ELA182]
MGAVFFLIGCSFEVLVINDLYASQHVLLILLLFMLISWLFVNAFAYAEFQRANQLQLQMSALERA